MSVPSETEHLFAAGPVRFVLAEFCLVLHLTVTLDFHKLIDYAQRGHIPRCREFGTHAEGVNGRRSRDQLRYLVFIQIAAGKDHGPAKSVPVEDFAYFPALRQQIAAIKTYSSDV